MRNLTLAVSALLVMASVSVASAETTLERGAYLAKGIVACGNCHTPQTPKGPAPGMEMAGTFLTEDPAFKAFAPNITPDKKTGIGNWTKAQLIRAIREGVRPDGSIIGPPMPIGLYRGMSDKDVDAVATYVMSIPPVSNAVPKSEYRIPLPPSYGPPVGSVAEVSKSDKVAYGAYMAGPLGHCIECHTPFIKGMPDFANQLGAGGFEFHGPWGVSVSANITPHADSKVSGYTDMQLKAVTQTGVRPDGTRLLPPMGVYYYGSIKGRDIDALVAYLRSMPAKPNPN